MMVKYHFSNIGNNLILLTIPREKWEESIKEVLEKNKDKKDEGVIFELLDDSDLKISIWIQTSSH
jgi:hypothetical protein